MGALSSLPTVKPGGDTDALINFPETNSEQFLARWGEKKTTNTKYKFLSSGAGKK